MPKTNDVRPRSSSVAPMPTSNGTGSGSKSKSKKPVVFTFGVTPTAPNEVNPAPSASVNPLPPVAAPSHSIRPLRRDLRIVTDPQWHRVITNIVTQPIVENRRDSMILKSAIFKTLMQYTSSMQQSGTLTGSIKSASPEQVSLNTTPLPGTVSVSESKDHTPPAPKKEASSLSHYATLYENIKTALGQESRMVIQSKDVMTRFNLANIFESKDDIATKLDKIIHTASKYMAENAEVAPTRRFCVFKSKVTLSRIGQICKALASIELTKLNTQYVQSLSQQLNPVDVTAKNTPSTVKKAW